MEYVNDKHKAVTEAKMKTIAEWQKSPKNWDKIDKQIQEHYEAHGQINPNKKTKL